MATVTIDPPDNGKCDLLKEVEECLEGYGDEHRLLFRSMLMPVLDKHLTDLDKHIILSEWHIRISKAIRGESRGILDDFREDR